MRVTGVPANEIVVGREGPKDTCWELWKPRIPMTSPAEIMLSIPNDTVASLSMLTNARLSDVKAKVGLAEVVVLGSTPALNLTISTRAMVAVLAAPRLLTPIVQAWKSIGATNQYPRVPPVNVAPLV